MDMTPDLPEPVEIAAGAWQLLPVSADDLGELAALDEPAELIAALQAEVGRALDHASTAWTIRTAVGGWIEGVVAASRPDGRGQVGTLELRTLSLPGADRAASTTAHDAVGRYVQAVGFTLLAH